MANIVLAHGAWSAAWAWKKMRPLMRAAGHEFWSPTYTGLGERAHLARPDIDLSTHVQDVAAVLELEDLKEVTLLGHSYGGMVSTGVADKAPGRIARVVYIDAFAPKEGQSLFDLLDQRAKATCGPARPRMAMAGNCRSIRCPPTPRRKMLPGQAHAAGRSRSRPSSRRSGSSRRGQRRRGTTSTPRRADRATCSASSASAPRASRDGNIGKSMPAIIRTSPAPMC